MVDVPRLVLAGLARAGKQMSAMDCQRKYQIRLARPPVVCPLWVDTAVIDPEIQISRIGLAGRS